MSTPNSFRIIFILCLIMFWQQNCFSQENQSLTSSQFDEANAFYKNGKYSEAIQRYEEILNRDLANGALYYNLGNSYFKTGNLGKAILNYERARELIPRDNDLNANNEYALSLVKGPKMPWRRNGVVKFASQYKNLVTINELTLIGYLMSVFMAAIFLAGLYRRWPFRPVIFVIVILGVAMVFHSTLLYQKIREQDHLAVVITQTESRFEPIDQTTVHFELPEGEVVEILNEESGWFKLRRLDGKMGWSKTKMIERL